MKNAKRGRHGLDFLAPDKRLTVEEVDEQGVKEPALQDLRVSRILRPRHSQDENDRLEEHRAVSHGIKSIPWNIEKQMTKRDEQQGNQTSGGRIEQNIFYGALPVTPSH